MKKSIKKHLKSAYGSPDPTRKDSFIRTQIMINRSHEAEAHTPIFRIVRVQAGYINVLVWLVTAGVLLFAVRVLRMFDADAVALLAAMMPFLSGLAVLEYFRSRLHGMSELESVTRFSAGGIMLARMIAIGAAHLILLAALTALLGGRYGGDYLLTGAYLTIPYLLSSVLSLEAERTPLGRKNILVCLACSAGVSASALMLSQVSELFEAKNRGLWLAATAVLFVAEIYEAARSVREEESQWSLMRTG